MSTNDPSVPPSQPSEPGPPPQSPGAPPPQPSGAEQPPVEQPAPPPQPGYPPPDAQQPAPSQQPGEYQQPPPPAAQPEWATQQPGPSGGGLDPKIGAMLSYLLFGWIGGLIMFFTQKHPEVRFHAAQSIIVFGALHIAQIVLVFILPGTFLFLLGNLVGLLAFVLWILLSIKGYNLEHFKLPIAGDLAEQWASKPA